MVNTVFDFENDVHWKSIPSDAMQLIRPWNFPVSLSPPTTNPVSAAEDLEKSLKQKIYDYRMSTFLSMIYHRRNANVNGV